MSYAKWFDYFNPIYGSVTTILPTAYGKVFANQKEKKVKKKEEKKN